MPETEAFYGRPEKKLGPPDRSQFRPRAESQAIRKRRRVKMARSAFLFLVLLFAVALALDGGLRPRAAGRRAFSRGPVGADAAAVGAPEARSVLIGELSEDDNQYPD